MAADVLKKLAGEMAPVKARRALPPPQERRELRQAAGLTQEQMARLIGCTRAAVSRFEAGRDPRDGAVVNNYRTVLNRLRLEGADGEVETSPGSADRAATDPGADAD